MIRSETADEDFEEQLVSAGVERFSTSRKTTVRIFGQVETDQTATEQALARIRGACPLAGECALVATCEDYNEHHRSEFGWMHDWDEKGIDMIITDSAPNCSNPNAHIEIVNEVLTTRGDEQLTVE